MAFLNKSILKHDSGSSSFLEQTRSSQLVQPLLEPAGFETIRVDFPAQVEAIEREAAAFDAKKAELEKANCDLTIAIVGQVKSGKSSFLNALLFDGDGILPQAATPMTAALTFIRYDETCHAEVEFFSKGEWERFKVQAAKLQELKNKVRKELEEREDREEKYAKRDHRFYVRREITERMVLDELEARADPREKIGPEDIAADELVRMAEKGGASDLLDCLGTTKRIENVSTPQELIGRLQDYVGADGHFTPIVCSTTLYLNDPHLKGYRIVDTPGTNDPVISRGKKTTDNLKKANVVVVLSRAGHFFDNADLALCSQNLPGSGIADFLMLASQYDSEIRGEATKTDANLPPGKRLVETVRRVMGDIERNYRVRISELANQSANEKSADREKWEKLLKQDLYFISAKAHILSCHWDRLTAKEREELAIFDAMIPGFSFNAKTLDQISRMSLDKKGDGSFASPIRQKIEEVKAKKDAYLQQQRSTVETEKRRRISEMIADLRSCILSRIEVLETKDLDQLQKDLAEQTRLLENGRSMLADVFDAVIASAKERFSSIVADVRSSQDAYMKLAVNEESHQEAKIEYVARGGVLGDMVDWLVGPQAVTKYHTYKTRYADSYEAVEKVDAFSERARSLMEDGINKVSSDLLSRQLHNRLADAACDFIEANKVLDFDASVIKAEIRRAIQAIRIPTADFGKESYSAAISDNFIGGRVEDGAVDSLRRAQSESVRKVVADLSARAEEKISEIVQAIETARDAFVDDLIKDLKSNNEQMKADLNRKADTLARYKKHVEVLTS